MAVHLKGRSLDSLLHLTREEIEQVLKTAELLKLQLLRGEEHPLLRGKTLAMIFEKPSTRTRVSFEVGMWQLGGYALYLSAGDLQLGRGETIADTARVRGKDEKPGMRKQKNGLTSFPCFANFHRQKNSE